ncbi:5'-methylthioadenosine/S-adenosylhomocysteine nucleosidase [soil metagenome]
MNHMDRRFSPRRQQRIGLARMTGRFAGLASLFASALFLAIALATPATAQRLDARPRTAIMTAFLPERVALEAALKDRKDISLNGLAIATGTVAGRPVILMESGVSMVNAAMNAQLLIDRFTVSRIVFSGIAGGVDPALHIGDVVVPDHWGQYLETVMARQTPDGFAPVPGLFNPALPAYGMMFPRAVRTSSAATGPVQKDAFAVDPTLLKIARTVAATLVLDRCADPAGTLCLVAPPAIVVGGQGISGPAFIDNAAYRDYLFATYQARVLDMESAAVAQVAFANGTPFIAFRSLSDLAGGGGQDNQMHLFMTIASGNAAAVVRAFVGALAD